jgi:hypothetical protein
VFDAGGEREVPTPAGVAFSSAGRSGADTTMEILTMLALRRTAGVV